ncbi:G-protein alpha subunit-domain-containing protein [Mycena latifolia]|nr:G-protein alpha subunit-domain-containing protein [Mycena latifolia]
MQRTSRHNWECAVDGARTGDAGCQYRWRASVVERRTSQPMSRAAAAGDCAHYHGALQAAVYLACENRMRELLYLFESVINSRWFLRTSVILFLNKIDVFKRKLPKIPLGRYFPEYAGRNDLQKAAKYILWKFMQENRAKLTVYPHVTQATNTKNIRLVFAAVKETILQNALKNSGIL